MKKITAFTLTELLVALGIIGAIAALAVPSTLNNIHNRTMANQMKSVNQSLQTLIYDQMLKHKTKNLSETDFSSFDKLFQKTNFDITRLCKNDDKNCWKTNSSATGKVTYKKINGGDVDFNNKTYMKNGALLTNGTLLGFETQNGALADGDTIIAHIVVDVNGNEPPNILGRDFHSIHITKKGRIIGDSIMDGNKAPTTTAEKITKCKAGSAGYCFDVLVDNGWVMSY